MFAAGSIPWLLQHELRLAWRTMFSRKGAQAKKRRFSFPPLLLIPVFLIAGMVLVGLPLARWLADIDIVLTPLLMLAADLVVAFVVTLMLSQTVVNAVQVFYDRGDLDLLLSSPLSPTRVLTVRVLAMAVNPTLLVWALASIFVIPLAFYGHPEFLAAYPLAAALALFASALGIALALFLFKTIGPRRTRTVAQVLAALIGGIFVIVFNLPNIMGTQDTFWVSLGNDAMSGTLSIPSPLDLPARALFGEIGPLLILLAVAMIVFVAVAYQVGRRFAQNAAAAQGTVAAASPRRIRQSSKVTFGANVFRSVISKEWRLLRRDPAVLSQILLRVIYLIPLAIVFGRGPEDADAIAAAAEAAAANIPPLQVIIGAGALALLAGQIAGSIAWLVIAAEDSPQLLATSPIPIRSFWRAKLVITMLIPGILIVPIALVLAVFEPLAGVIALIGAAGSALSAGLVHLWLQKPVRRSEFRKQWNNSFVPTILELLLSLAWAGAAGAAVAGSVWALAPLVLVVVTLALTRRTEQQMLERLQAA